MKKSNPQNEEYHKFWFGFAVGSAFCGAAAMAVGTKQGRDFLKKSLSYLETIDGSSDQIHQLTSALASFTENATKNMSPLQAVADISTAVTSLMSEPESASSEAAHNQPQTAPQKPKQQENSLNALIDKMRDFAPGKKSDAKFFKKSKK